MIETQQKLVNYLTIRPGSLCSPVFLREITLSIEKQIKDFLEFSTLLWYNSTTELKGIYH